MPALLPVARVASFRRLVSFEFGVAFLCPLPPSLSFLARLSGTMCMNASADHISPTTQINTPRGVSVWYGRVTPHEVDAIVKETIIGGRILPALLRGGLNLCHPGQRSLNDW